MACHPPPPPPPPRAPPPYKGYKRTNVDVGGADEDLLLALERFARLPAPALATVARAAAGRSASPDEPRLCEIVV
eukprot:SAG31_NODE_9526_length_1264_cov_1.154506_2_plen_75_part_00